MHALSDLILILVKDSCAISDLRTAKEDHSGNTELKRQKNEKEIRTYRSDETELREKPRARSIRKHGTKQTG
jgi:hypothetical protein